MVHVATAAPCARRLAEPTHVYDQQQQQQHASSWERALCRRRWAAMHGEVLQLAPPCGCGAPRITGTTIPGSCACKPMSGRQPGLWLDRTTTCALARVLFTIGARTQRLGLFYGGFVVGDNFMADLRRDAMWQECEMPVSRTASNHWSLLPHFYIQWPCLAIRNWRRRNYCAAL
jgi:hypothetical protein